jgi:hypothetical protein
MSKPIGIIAVVVLFSLAAALLYMGIVQPAGNGAANAPARPGDPSSLPSDEGDSPTVLPGDIELYASDEQGISFHYPSKYFVEEFPLAAASGTFYHVALLEDTAENRALVAGELPGREYPPGITVDVFPNPDGLSVADWMKMSMYSNYGLGSGEYALLETEQGLAASYTWSGLYEGHTVLLAHRGSIVSASVTYLTREDAAREEFADLLQSLALEE